MGIGEAVMTSTHNLCLGAKHRPVGYMCIPVYPIFILKVGLKVYTLHVQVFLVSNI